MRYVIDHDYHIHSTLSSCCKDPEQTPEAILRYGETNGLKEICLTNHVWDDTVAPAGPWYQPQNIPHIRSILPLPQSEKVRFHFGCEADIDQNLILGLSDEAAAEMDFINVAVSHLHIESNVPKSTPLEQRAVIYVQRMNVALNSSLPDGKVGFAHPTTPLIANAAPDGHLRVLDMIPDSVMIHLFTRAAERRFGVELNFDATRYTPEQQKSAYRLYHIAKECGCKFYLGSDAHSLKALDAAMEKFDRMIDALGLTEDDKFKPFA